MFGVPPLGGAAPKPPKGQTANRDLKHAIKNGAHHATRPAVLRNVAVATIGALIILIVCLLTGCSTPKPAGTAKRPHPPVSPDITNGNVTFRFSAPQAEGGSMSLAGTTNLAMRKDSKGVWSLTVSNLAPELYEYNFSVDGISTVHPGNPAVKRAGSAHDP